MSDNKRTVFVLDRPRLWNQRMLNRASHSIADFVRWQWTLVLAVMSLLPGLPHFSVTGLVQAVATHSSQSLDQSLGQSVHEPLNQPLNQLLTGLVLEHLPHDYVDEKKWGQQSERWDGVDMKFVDGKLRTHRRKKKVNHGTWQRYTVDLMNPHEEFSVHVANMRQLPDGAMAFDVQCAAHVKLHARQSKWVKGVQLYSISADGHARVKLAVSMQLETHLDITKFPPDLIFDPKATAADIDVEDFRIDRVSKAGGEFAQQVSRGVRASLDEKIIQKEQKLVDKINKEFLENKRSLRLSISGAAKNKWASSAKAFLPQPVRAALGDD